MKRPAALVCLFYASGILAAEWIHLPFASLVMVASALWILSMAWGRGRGVLLPLLLFAIGIISLRSRIDIFSEDDLRRILGCEPHLVQVRGKLLESPLLRPTSKSDQKSEAHSQARLSLSAIKIARADWRPAVGTVVLTAKGPLTNFFAGQVVEADGVTSLPPLPAAEGLFDYRAYLKQQGIFYILKCSTETDLRLIAGPRNRPLADRFTEWTKFQLARGLDEDLNVHLEWALTLGAKSFLTEDISEPFIRAATYHIFAVDGLRMAILFGIFFAILRVFRVSRLRCGFFLLPVIWFYVQLTGWPASAIRAAVMLSIVMIGWMLRRPTDLANSLFISAILILAWEPRQLFQAGFQLSFLVVLSMLLLLPPLRDWVDRTFHFDPLLPDELRPKWQRWLRVPARRISDLCLTSFAAWIGSIPLVAYYFHLITPISTPANILAVPLCALVLISNLTSLIIAAFWSAPAILFNHAGWFFMELIRRLSVGSADVPSAYFYVAAPGWGAIALYYFLLFALLIGVPLRPFPQKAKTAAFSLLLFVWVIWLVIKIPAPALHIMNPEGGTVIFSRTGPKDSGLLIDCGNDQAARRITTPFLHAQGINHLSNIVLSHGDIRQMGGVQPIRDEFSVSKVWISPVHFRSPVYRQSILALSATSNLLQTVNRGDRIGAWQVLHPYRDDHFPKADDNTLVLLGQLEGVRILLLSDLSRIGQNLLLERYPSLKADVLISGIPGQGEPLSDALIRQCEPHLLVVVDADYPANRRASAKLRSRLANCAVPVVYTRTSGAITLEPKRNSWKLHSISGFSLNSIPGQSLPGPSP